MTHLEYALKTMQSSKMALGPAEVQLFRTSCEILLITFRLNLDLKSAL